MPGDSRAQVGFIGFNSALHFIQFGSEENSRAHVHVVTDIDGEKKMKICTNKDCIRDILTHCLELSFSR